MPRGLPRTVWVLAAVSLLNDAASEMIAPLLPIFLTLTLGAGPAIVGLIEGAAEAATSVLKLIAGRLADRGVDRRKLVIGGYAIANIARPLLGFVASWTQVLALRLADRAGKGLRSAPRDALLAASVDSEVQGRAFGVHRSADHLGAMVGPLIAAGLLAMGLQIRSVFLIAGVLGAITIGTLVIGLKSTPPQDAKVVTPKAPPLVWRGLDPSLRAFLVAVAAVTAATVPEALIVLWALERGIAVVWIPVLWAVAHAVKAGVAWPFGELADRLGAMRVLAFGWPLRVAALLALAYLEPAGAAAWMLFIAYAGSLAATEAAERSLIAAAAPRAVQGTAYGWYHLFAGLGALPGAWLIGYLWQTSGSRPALLAAAVIGGLACIAAAALAARTGTSFRARSPAGG
jgi:MFS family permease